MASLKIFTVLACLSIASCTPTSPRTFLGSTVEEMRALCANDDPIACLKFKAYDFLESLFKKDSYQVSDNVEINRNSYRANEITARSQDGSLEDKVEDYLKTHDATFKIPGAGATVTLGTSNLDEDELNLNVKFSTDAQARGKSKIKKIMIPIMIFVLLKAITLIPLALGVLGLKAWNALQLSFFSFIVAISLAVFQLCKKIAADHAHPQIASHGPWESLHYKRSFDNAPSTSGQELAYSAYLQ